MVARNPSGSTRWLQEYPNSVMASTWTTSTQSRLLVRWVETSIPLLLSPLSTRWNLHGWKGTGQSFELERNPASNHVGSGCLDIRVKLSSFPILPFSSLFNPFILTSSSLALYLLWHHQVIDGIYEGVTTVELDNLAAETAAYKTTTHPDYAVLAARIAISNLHKETKKTFSQVVQDLYDYGEYIDKERRKNGEEKGWTEHQNQAIREGIHSSRKALLALETMLRIERHQKVIFFVSQLLS